MDEPTLRPKTQRGAQKHLIVKSVLSVRRHYPKRGRFTENLSIYLSSPAPNSPLQNPSNFGVTASHWLLYILLFFFFLIFNRMDAWSLMHGDAFIHFVSGSRRVNIRLGVLLLIPKSPQVQTPVMLLLSLSDKYPWERYEPPYPFSYYCSSRRMDLVLNNPKKLN